MQPLGALGRRAGRGAPHAVGDELGVGEQLEQLPLGRAHAVERAAAEGAARGERGARVAQANGVAVVLAVGVEAREVVGLQPLRELGLGGIDYARLHRVGRQQEGRARREARGDGERLVGRAKRHAKQHELRAGRGRSGGAPRLLSAKGSSSPPQPRVPAGGAAAHHSRRVPRAGAQRPRAAVRGRGSGARRLPWRGAAAGGARAAAGRGASGARRRRGRPSAPSRAPPPRPPRAPAAPAAGSVRRPLGLRARAPCPPSPAARARSAVPPAPSAARAPRPTGT
eukprot:1109028-Prymnesium_polylepis.2